MSNVNKCIFIGRCGKDPEVKVIGNDYKVSNFSIAVTERWTDKTTGEKKELTEWINMQAANKQAELIEKYVNKGDMLYIEGKFKTRSWEKDGVKHYATYIQVDAIQLFPKSSNQTEQSNNQSNPSGLPPTEYATQSQPEEDDLPF